MTNETNNRPFPPPVYTPQPKQTPASSPAASQAPSYSQGVPQTAGYARDVEQLPASPQAAPQAPLYPQMPVPPTQAKKSASVAKVFAGIAIAFVVAVLLIGAIVLASLFQTCSAVLFDAPTHDSRAHAAFIKDTQATERDLETFDALSGCFEEMYYSYVDAHTEGEKSLHRGEAKQAVDEYRALLAQGTWPQDIDYFSEGDSSLSPQLWVRMAQLAQDYIEEETQEQWRVANVSYPFLSNPGPVPDLTRQHDAEDHLVTTLICESGEDAGRTASVSYYRWANPAYFESSVELVRENTQEQRQALANLEASGLLEGRICAFTMDNHLFVWSQGTEDSLRNYESFTQFMRDAAHVLKQDSLKVHLLEVGAPLVLSTVFTSTYGNTLPPELIECDKAQDRLIDCLGDNVHVAFVDKLLSQEMHPGSGAYSSPDEILVSGISGYLAERYIWLFGPWSFIGEECVFDSDTTTFVAEQLGLEEESVLVLSSYTQEPGNSFHSSYDDWDFHVILSRGALPETFTGAYRVVQDLEQTLQQHVFANIDKSAFKTLSLRVYLVDPQEAQGANGPATFNELRAAVLEDIQNINTFDTALLLRLHTMAESIDAYSTYESQEIDGEIWAEGPLTELRAWFLESYGFNSQSS